MALSQIAAIGSISGPGKVHAQIEPYDVARDRSNSTIRKLTAPHNQVVL
jgi:hypothetical protein